MSEKTGALRRGVLAAGAALLLSPVASAHQVGVSQGRYGIDGDRVHAELTFARTELLDRLTRLSASGSAPSSAELAPALQKELVPRLLIRSESGPCEGSVESVHDSAPDGLVVATEYRCEPSSGDLHADLRFLDVLEHGHRHVAHVSTGGVTTDLVLYEGNSAFDLGAAPARATNSSFFGFVRFGVAHILSGPDHLLFLLGVALLPAPLRATLLAITAFTVAHSLTLAVSLFGVFDPSPLIIEPLILVSVAYVGLENLLRRSGSRRYIATFTFGLVHGFGFAGALREIALPRPEIPFALAGFNLGVELGQLLVLVPLLVLLRRVQTTPWFSRWAYSSLNIALASVGLGWAVIRIVSMRPSEPAVSAQSTVHHSILTATSHVTGTAPAPLAPVTSALVERLCRTFDELPRTRRAECAHQRPGVTVVAQCEKALNDSLSSGALQVVDASQVDRCIQDWTNRYRTCDFIQQASLPPVETCRALFHGRLLSGATCHSSSECADTLHCDGSGPTDPGRCLPPRTAGRPCGLSVDGLTSYVPDGTTTEHPECTGECVDGRCGEARVASVVVERIR